MSLYYRKAGAWVVHQPSSPITPTNTGSAPGSIATLSATSTSNSITATWSAATDPDGDLTGYEVFLNGVSQGRLGIVLTATFTNLAAATNYTVAVRAYDSFGHNGPTTTQSVATQSVAAPSTITHGQQLTAADVGPRVATTSAAISGTQTLTTSWLTANNGGSNIISGKRFLNTGFNVGAGIAGVSGNTVIFRDCEFIGGGWANAGAYFNLGVSGSPVPAGFKLQFEYCRWDQQQQVSSSMEVGVYGGQWSALRCEYKNGAGLHRDDYSDISCTECYVHDLYVPAGSAHYACIGFIGGNNLTVERCKLFPVNFDGITASLTALAQGGGSTNVRIVDNAMQGGPYSLNAGSSVNVVTNSVATGNVFYRDYARKSGDYGPETGFQYWTASTISNNTWGPYGPYNVAGDPAPGDPIPV